MDTTSGIPAARSSFATHLPSLNGLRAISIGLVLAGHLNGTRGFLYLNWRPWLGDIAYLGVMVFFVISGFLITGLLLEEQRQHGRISLPFFYLRRAFRIFPASYTYLAAIGLAAAIGWVHLLPGDVWHAVTYTINYHPERSWHMGHLWSLSVEEQFYLLWPFVLLILGPARGMRTAAGVLVAAPLYRLAVRLFLHHTPLEEMEAFPALADSLAAGCLMAGLRDWLAGRRWYERITRTGAFWVLPVLAILLNLLRDYGLVRVFGVSLMNVVLAVMIDRFVAHPGDWFGRLLNTRPFETVGILSYSLYLWQQPFLNRASGAWIAAFPQNLCLVALCALASYHVVEKPLLRRGKRFRRI